MTNYHPQDIEKKWAKIWEKNSLYKAEDQPAGRQDFAKKKKYYALVEFPYPSGEGLHIGHAFTNIIGDILARQKRMAGFNVLYPMGWDAFGLPTENSAIKLGIPPAVLTKRNTTRFKDQNNALGISFDWDREIDTTDPNYYRWTQWIFLQLFKHGLAYKAPTPVGWCPSCKIILANEEIIGGRCERCGATAEHRNQSQWLLKITKYADRLADDLDLVDYPDYVKKSQRDWIGRTEGVEIEYPVIGSKLKVVCYSTRPETNFGATFIVIAPEHPIVASLLKLKTQNSKLKTEIEEYIKRSKTRSELERTSLEKEKTGVFTGLYALNRLSGKKMPIWVADFVVLTAGTGMVVGVPAHDERDFAFAKKYGLEIVTVLDINNTVVFNSDFLNGLPVLKAKEKIIAYLVKKGWGKRAKNYHLRDWIFSRQHYWGEPIPMIYCESCAKKGITWWDTTDGKKFKNLDIKNSLKIENLKFKIKEEFNKQLAGWFPVEESKLPIKLPSVERYQPTDTGESPLAKIREWVEVACPECGRAARRETDTMPNWAGSSWYYLRFCDPHSQRLLANRQKLNYWLPVDIYVGGAEHTTLHLLYSRFWHKFLYDLGVVPGKEPYAARRQHGIILGEDNEKMSKSRGNVINPESIVLKFGADTLRIYLMFMGPYDSTMPWNTNGLEGSYRFLSRIWRIYTEGNKIIQKTSAELSSELQKLIKKVTSDIEALKHNTAIAAMMEFLNKWQSSSSAGLSKADAGNFLKLLAPFAPFLAEELWQGTWNLKHKTSNKLSVTSFKSVHQQPWPKFDPKLVKDEAVTIVIQVNGKLRGQLQIESQKCPAKGWSASGGKVQSEIEKLAKKEERVAKYLANKKIRQTIFVPGRLINFVID